MQLVGMLGSPYVRRVAVALNLLGIPYDHRPLSVFRGFDEIRAINPVVKVPTLVCDDGTVLMDSSLIIDYAESIGHGSLRRWAPSENLRYLWLEGLVLAMGEKAVALVMELEHRPTERQYPDWIERVTQQLHAACDALERAQTQTPLPATEAEIDRVGVTLGAFWYFLQQSIADIVPAERYPALCRFSADVEALDAFRAAPYGDAACPWSGSRS